MTTRKQTKGGTMSRKKWRSVVIVGLLSAAFWSALPWLGSVSNPITHTVEPVLLRVCTFGDPALLAGYGLSGFAVPTGAT